MFKFCIVLVFLDCNMCFCLNKNENLLNEYRNRIKGLYILKGIFDEIKLYIFEVEQFLKVIG